MCKCMLTVWFTSTEKELTVPRKYLYIILTQFVYTHLTPLYRTDEDHLNGARHWITPTV